MLSKVKYKALKATLAIGVLLLLAFLGYTSFQNQQYEKIIGTMKLNSTSGLEIPTTVEHKQLNRNGYSIHYFVSGNPKNEAIVFLHPAFGDHHCFDQQVRFFSDNYYVITVDMLGHGLSQVTNSDDKIDITPEHIREILEKEGIEQAHLVGNSLGGIIAQQFAMNYPAKTRSLAGVGTIDTKRKYKEVSRAQVWEGIKWVPRILISMKWFRRYVASVSVRKPEQQAVFYESASKFTRSSFKVMSGLQYYNTNSKIPEQKVPLLIMTGEHDLEISKKASELWHKNEPRSQFHFIKDAGHCPNMDNPEEFNLVLNNFLNTTNKKPGTEFHISAMQ